jgi:uncharacterized delta-60 repeat protein
MPRLLSFVKAQPIYFLIFFIALGLISPTLAPAQSACASGSALPETVQAQPARLDETFNPVLESFAGTATSKILPLPDGKLLGLCASGWLCRLNGAGGLDASFQISGNIGTLLLQPDGKILLSGYQLNIDGAIYSGVVRFNPDMTLDATFNAQALLSAGTMALQADGKILVSAYFIIDGVGTVKLVRLNTDGSIDNSFNAVRTNPPIAIVPQPDFKTLVSYSSDGGWSGEKPIRLNADGSVDSSFNTTNTSVPQNVKSMILQPDGKLIVGGGNITRLNTDGSSDETFAVGGNFNHYFVYDLALQPDGKIIIGGYPYQYSSPYPPVRERVARINADGTPDNTFNVGTGFETNFNDAVYEVNLLPGGKILASGSFYFVNNQERPGLVRLHANGGVDTSFNTGLRQPSGIVDILFRQPDRKILIGGNFDFLNNNPTRYIARLNPDGSVDTTFRSNAAIRGKIKAFAVQPDGKILVAGEFYLINGTGRGLIRLNADGAMDNSFVSPTSLTHPHSIAIGIYSVTALADGKILIGGNFANINDSGRAALARLNPNGTIDNSYTVTTNTDSVWASVTVMLRQSNGKIVTNGKLVQNGVTKFPARLNADGSLDTTFIYPPNHSTPYALLADDRIVSGSNTYNGCTYFGMIHRFTPEGTGDPTFSATLSGGYGLSFRFWTSDRLEVFYNDGTGLRKLKPAGGIDNNFSLPLQGWVNDYLFSGNRIYVGGAGSIGIDGAYRLGLMRLIYGNSSFDYDGDGKADISVFRPSVGDWYLSRSFDNAFVETSFGLAEDLIAPADFDADGRADISVFRPSAGSWYRLNSSNNSFSAVQFGANGDLPVPGDFDGDGRADVAIYRPSAGSWYRLNSSDNQSVGVQFGIAEDKPLVGDFDGDGKSDLAVFRPSNGTWYRINSGSDSFAANQFGVAEDKPVAADFDGDGKTDLAVFRPSSGYWYIINSGSDSFTATQFGIAEDKPAPADYDGDGKADLAVFRPTGGFWYLLRTTAGFTGAQFGAGGDVATPNAFVR